MATIRKSEFQGEVVWLGKVPDAGGIAADAQDGLDLTFDGLEGERHAGTLRPSCVRVTALYPKGTKIRNVRQLSILSIEELSAIAAAMGMERLDPAYLGASMVVKGIPDFTHIPPSSRLQFPSGLTLTVDMENQPCVLPGREVERDHAGFGAKFKTAAEGRRGVTAWVEHPGPVAMGDSVSLFVPVQRAWTGEMAAAAE
ncbi:MOSC domain-containing protein [Chachezhania antarctica]|uniref:MOSC domain-containing protein n=1 Tax=Chachezhania antarctica TaxID=2340860 RepID=UPI000EB25753|nr:MOSC domain-containing protein [Chachezhania antarctica]|tara:strand:- start:3116 stop:3712 length:597 start_codon:yes stop_codon:yes gene_type:complete